MALAPLNLDRRTPRSASDSLVAAFSKSREEMALLFASFFRTAGASAEGPTAGLALTCLRIARGGDSREWMVSGWRSHGKCSFLLFFRIVIRHTVHAYSSEFLLIKELITARVHHQIKEVITKVA